MIASQSHPNFPGYRQAALWIRIRQLFSGKRAILRNPFLFKDFSGKKKEASKQERKIGSKQASKKGLAERSHKFILESMNIYTI